MDVTVYFDLSPMFSIKLSATKRSHFMITNPSKFSFPDAVHFNSHLSLTLKTVQSYPGVFSSFRTTNPSKTYLALLRGLL